MTRINSFLLQHALRIAGNPCISPDFCLDWSALGGKIVSGQPLRVWPKSRFSTAAGAWTLLEDDATGDCAWRLEARMTGAAAGTLGRGLALDGSLVVFPATWENLLRLKNLIQEADPDSTIFPTAGGTLGRGTIGVGARFTTLHWPAVEWAMSALDLSLTANQNSIPRELVYDVDAMLSGRLDTVPFPFIGADVPEGHQGQSVEGMSHGAVLSKLKSGFHQRRLPWSFNADHQPVGGKFDAREDRLVEGSVLASYITFDLSPELALNAPAAIAAVPAEIVAQVRARVAAAGIALDDAAFAALIARVWPALEKMRRRDRKYAAARAARFTTATGRAYLRELSIDELPGITTPETTAVMLALCEALGMRIDFIAPAFGFQKNTPYPDNAALRGLVERQWRVVEKFGAGIGFHSGSGKSAENYRVLGEVTGGRLEIKTSGRYTYEMGRALHTSSDPADQALWRDWHAFTVELALKGAFSPNDTEQQMARGFITSALQAHADRGAATPACADPHNPQARTARGAATPPSRSVVVPEKEAARESRDEDVASPTGAAGAFSSRATCRAALAELAPSPEHMFWFEYNFLYVLAAAGRPEKAALGDHSPAGYRQRARFYAISDEGRLRYAKNVAEYLVFLAEHTGLATTGRCAAARERLARYTGLNQMLDDIGTASDETTGTNGQATGGK